MKFKYLFLFLFISIKSFSQGEASNWFFGDKAGIKFNQDNTISVLSVTPNPIEINTNEGCSSFSDANGNLLLYTDGRTVWDRNHLIMPNGNYSAGTGLFGDPSSTQSGIIIPNPANPNIYYIFTVDEPHHQNAQAYPNQFLGTYEDTGISTTIPGADDGYNNGLNYSTVDISLAGTNGSMGDIISLNNHLVTYDPNPTGDEIKFKCSEKITAVKSQDGSGYWVITHFTNKFYAFKIDADGVNSTPVITSINPMVPVTGYRRNGIGQIKASPNGKKIAIAHNQLGTSMGSASTNGTVYIYDFNNATGSVSNPIRVIQEVNPYGVEFSAETRKLYVTLTDGVMQFNVETGSHIAASGVQVSTKSGASLQLGPDKKIYKANINSGNDASLDVINDPELDGLLCNYVPHALGLIAGTSRFGLPPFISSVFNSSISAKNLCLGDTTLFEVSSNGTIESAIWDFGDGSPVSTAISPSHVYGATGNYNISVTIIVEGNPVTNTKDITITGLPIAFAGELFQCSPTSATTNIPFNLSQADTSITGGDTILAVTYFLNETNALNGTNQLPNNYSNLTNPQQIVAKVTNYASQCFTLTTLDLNVTASPNPPVSLQKCDDSTEDGFTAFLLEEAVTAAPATATVTFYETLNNAFLEQNQISSSFTNTIANTQTVYVRMEENNVCLGIFPINLKVNPLPQIELQDTKYICTNRPTQFITLTAGLSQGNASNFTYDWSTGQTTPTIQVNLPGNYTVKVTSQFGCEKTRTISVLPSNDATIQNVVIQDLVANNTVTVLLNSASIGDYLYSLDSPNGPFQESNHFENVEAGFHTVYVYSTKGCGTTQEEISVLEIPKFFTPNQDGVNDTWNIIGMNASFYANSKIYIFDRFGKLLADVDPKSHGWNGVYNGYNLPSTDYWYLVTLENGRTVRGHFSLVR